MTDNSEVVLVGEFLTQEEADDVKGNLFVYDITNVHVINDNDKFKVIVTKGTDTVNFEDIIDSLIILGYDPQIIELNN